MDAYKVYHLLSPAFDLPVEVKLNEEDGYLRIAEPFYEVVHFRTPLFQPHNLSVTNVYGVPVFHIVPMAGQKNQWQVQYQHQTLMQINFAETALRPNIGTIGGSDRFAFSVAPGELANAAELQMLCAAMAVCYQHAQLQKAVPA